MSAHPDGQIPTPGSRRGSEAAERGRQFRVLRAAHIFASIVRDALETKLLRTVSDYPLSPPQFYLLKLMADDGCQHVGQAAGYLGVTPPAATRSVDKLERLGLVVRSPSAKDRRATLLTVSEKGRHLVRKYDEAKASRMAQVLEGLNATDVERFSYLLEQFSVRLMGSEGATGGCCLRCAANFGAGCPIGDARGGCPYEAHRPGAANQSVAARM